MSGMPKHWFTKVPEMVAMDRWFGVAALQAGQLAQRYHDAINRLSSAPDVFQANSVSLRDHFSGDQSKADTDMQQHFNPDWVNMKNPSSGGNYWPHIPTLNILLNMKQGIIAGALKGLGTQELSVRLPGIATGTVFESELDEAKLTADELRDVVPMSTSWVCTSPPGQGGFQVDAVRGPSVVDVVISTPWPQPQSRLWEVLGADLDVLWSELHGIEVHANVLSLINELPPWPQPPNPGDPPS